MNKFFLFSVFVCSCLFAKAQHPEAKRATHWYFGNGAGLDFSSGSPVAVTNGQLDSWESCASISDINGNLLFYTDGDTIWDKNHNIMPNGTGLYGSCVPPGPNNSATQGVIIIPQPNSATIFYVFTVDCAENLGARGMNYSMVDLSLNGGFGDVTLKNLFLFAPSTEGMAATMNCTRDSIWVVGHEYGTDAFYAYLVTENGLNNTPVISNTGVIVMNYENQMKFSPNGKKLAYYYYLFGFNFNSGQIDDSTFVNFGGYGLSFSPNGNKLYFATLGGLIGQYDVSSSNSIDIINSYQTIYQGIGNDHIGGMQLSIDSVIYLANYDTMKISKIEFPNNSGVSVNFSLNTVDLNGRKSQFTFPSFIESYFDQTYHPDSCNYDTLPIPPTDTTTNKNDALLIPNVFTPNGDGVNDVFCIKVSGYEKINWRIINRWGQTVKSGKLEVESDGYIELWDGRTSSGIKVPDGTYYYMINLTKKRGEQETKKGFVQILN
ncbi:MAG: gliding motility-associated C-terminal domain-containing protein [Flavobacteriales bacterium]|nr:gliding motility-associated C-terminal domain-containing protein [Flavobacteriales bacterium]